MRSRVYGITKDLVIIFFFGGCFFALTHNPVVRPTPTIIPGEWSIELRQMPLALGIAGHNYLALRNGEGVIVSQLHGLPTDIITGEWKYVGRNKTDVLKVWEFEENNPNEELGRGGGVALITTNEPEVKELWRKAKYCGDELNVQQLPYPPFGVSLREDTRNSNSVAYTLTACMGLAAKHIGLFTPGWGVNLLEN